MRNVCDFEPNVYFINVKCITRYEMTQSSCKRDTKSKSHPSVKLAPVRVFSCKHPLTCCTLHFLHELIGYFISNDLSASFDGQGRLWQLQFTINERDLLFIHQKMVHFGDQS